MKRLCTQLSLLAVLILGLTLSPLPSTRAAAGAFSTPCSTASGTGTLTGTVTNPAGTPMRGIFVDLYTANGDMVSTSTTASGTQTPVIYTFASIPVGTYLLNFRPPSHYQSEWYSHQSAATGATPILVNIGATTTADMQLQVATGTQFNVTIRDPDGNPVPPSTVSVFDPYGVQVAYGGTDSQGLAHTTPGLPFGPYRLQAMPSGSTLLPEYYNHKPTLAAADWVILMPDTNSANVQMTLTRGAQLLGTVKDAFTGALLDYITVSISGVNTSANVETLAGKYVFTGLPSGTYQITFHSDSTNALAPQGVAPLHRTVTLTAPNQLSNVDAALPRGGSISGNVTAPDGTPILFVYVVATSLADAAEYSSSPTDQLGNYTISGLPSGQYALRFVPGTASGFLSEYYNDQPAATHLDRVIVNAPNTTANINAMLALSGSVYGQVTDSGGNPLRFGAHVSVLDAMSQEVVGETDTGMQYVIGGLHSGSYLVQFRSLDPNTLCPYALGYYNNTGIVGGATRVSIVAPGSVGNINAMLVPGSLMTGTVTDLATGHPLQNVPVSVYDTGGLMVAVGYTNLLGHYQTDTGLPGAAYRVKFEEPRNSSPAGYAPVFYGGAYTLATAQTVMLQPPAVAANINAVLSHGGVITGRVTAAGTGAPLERALVTLYDAHGQPINTAQTTFDGIYNFSSELPLGSYSVGVVSGQTTDGIPYFTDYLPVFFGGASTLVSATPITLTAPQTVTADLAMPKAVRWPIYMPFVQH